VTDERDIEVSNQRPERAPAPAVPAETDDEGSTPERETGRAEPGQATGNPANAQKSENAR
jgi:hypothetical protein